MIRPKPLKKGDKIAVIAPSGPPVKERIQPALEFFKSLGLVPVMAENIGSELYGYLCGSDEIRAAQINLMFKDEKIRGIFAIRGGYGAARILDKIDYKMVSKNPKIFAGYSDITALHNVFNQKCRLITYHTPMAGTEFYKKTDSYTLDYFNQCIFNGCFSFDIKNPDNIPLESLSSGTARGVITGGNLSVIASLIGTPYEIKTKNKILFLEDIGESFYKIDRMLTQLELAGKFKNIKGIIFGYFTDCSLEDNKTKEEFKNMLKQKTGSKIPVIYNLCCGHSLPAASIPLGEEVFIDSDKCIIKKF